MQKNTLAVVVTYNRKAQLETCLRAVVSQDAACDILVVDNASTDGTQEMLEEKFSDTDLRYHNLGSNTGCAGGIHFGTKQALKEGYDRIWIMDDDVIPSATALSELLYADHVLNGKWGFLSSAAYWTDGALCKSNIQKKGVFRFVREHDYDAGPVRIKMASICSLMLNAAAVKEVGLPIPEYFFYTEDYEFTSRLARRYPCYLVPRSKVRHDMKVNAKANFVADSQDRMWRYRYLYRNDVHCYRQYGPVGWAYLLAKTGYTTASVLLREKEDKRGKLEVLYSSLREGLSFDPQVEYPEQ